MASKQTIVMRKLISICRMHRTLCNFVTQMTPLHRSQNIMLQIIADEKKAVSQNQIAKRLEISPAAASVAIKKLVGEGYCEKSFEENDNRVKNIKITQKGIEAVKKTHEIFSKLDARLFEELNEDEIEQLEKTLDRLERREKQILKEEKI